jgi:leucyl/phenylalanyl-tRNA---protein transferase
MSATSHNGTKSLLDPNVLELAYRNGFFPMADPDTGTILWHRPDPRAIIPIDQIRISHSLRKTLRKQRFTVTVNTCFEDVITACSHRPDVWISPQMIDAYTALHHLGMAHSVETWLDGRLVGGLYGVHLGAAFFGESMFSTTTDASKVAFAHLAAILQVRGFRLLDTQYINHHTASLGAVEIPDSLYQVLLADALSTSAEWSALNEADRP